MPSDSALVLYGLGALAVYFCVKRYRYLNDLSTIPTVGPSGFFSSFSGALQYMKDSASLIEEGYRQYPDRAFKIYTTAGWQIIVSSKMLADYKKAPDDQLSFTEAVNKVLAHDMYHAHIVKTLLTRNIGARLPDVCDELLASFNDLIPAKEDKWISIHANKTIMQVVARASNRFFVGLPICRNQDYINLNIEYTIDVAKSAMFVRLFPGPLRSYVARFFTNLSASNKRAYNHLAPLLAERLEKENEYGPNYEGRPNDCVSWLLEIAEGSQRTVEDLVLRLMSLNFAAIHTTSTALTHALYDLAANPQYIEALREEVDAVVSEYGWNKASMQKLRKLDSFIKESNRMWGNGFLGSNRLAMRDMTFSNGQVVPAGFIIGLPLYSVHHDEAVYDNPMDFRPFRFSDMREEDGEGIHHQLVTPTNEFLLFGIGRHACPGRFFAGNEIKLALAQIITNYDVRFEDGVRPPNFHIGSALAPNKTAHVLFRKRAKA